jgi:hypothetical protein
MRSDEANCYIALAEMQKTFQIQPHVSVIHHPFAINPAK